MPSAYPPGFRANISIEEVFPPSTARVLSNAVNAISPGSAGHPPNGSNIRDIFTRPV